MLINSTGKSCRYFIKSECISGTETWQKEHTGKTRKPLLKINKFMSQ
jgi:hypothetical protein